VLKGDDQHSLDGLYDKSDLYSVFSTLPTFLYVILGNIILLFIIELIVHYKKSQL
jgi:prolipoprotein diacylglyceryltransferase